MLAETVETIPNAARAFFDTKSIARYAHTAAANQAVDQRTTPANIFTRNIPATAGASSNTARQIMASTAAIFTEASGFDELRGYASNHAAIAAGPDQRGARAASRANRRDDRPTGACGGVG